MSGAHKPALVLWGPRRMGKTSVLKQLPRLLGADFAPALVDVQSAEVRQNLAGFLTSITRAASSALLQRGVRSESPPASAFAQDAFSAFAEWRRNVEVHLGETRYLLVCLDEYERLEQSILDGQLPRVLLDEFRHTIQHHPHIVLLFAGSHRPRELHLNWSDALISTRLIRVSYLAREDVEQLITQAVPDFPVTYEPDALERIIQATRCHPNWVQALCYELVEELNDQKTTRATCVHVEAAIASALEKDDEPLAEMWSGLTPVERDILSALARAASARADELAAMTAHPQEQVASSLVGLDDRSIVEATSDSDGWRFQVPFVREWVRRQKG